MKNLRALHHRYSRVLTSAALSLSISGQALAEDLPDRVHNVANAASDDWLDAAHSFAAVGRTKLVNSAAPTLPESNRVIRYRGVLSAPKNGDLQLSVSAGGFCEIYLSANGDPTQRKKVADISAGSLPPLELDNYSAPVAVTSGQSVYVEIWHKRKNKDSDLQLSWRFGKTEKFLVVPDAALTGYQGATADANDDGLADAWVAEHEGLTEDSWADDDNDGVSNFQEFVAGTDPLSAESVAGKLLLETWTGVHGGQVRDLLRNPRFLGKPNEARWIDSSLSPEVYSPLTGSRLSGLIKPDVTANYLLAVSGDEQVELWISNGPSPLNRRRVAFGTSYRKPNKWVLPPSQISKPIILEAGNSYYFQVIHKNAGALGWCGIGWKKEADEEFQAIPASCFASPAPDFNDLNRDFLPDSWVQTHMSQLPEAMQSKILLCDFADGDQDGLPNWLESQILTSPFEKNPMSETLIREWWFNVGGNSIDEARVNKVFLTQPSMLSLSHGARAETYTTDYFASRYRGYIKAPATGMYRFWISGDDQVEMWLSTDDTKYRKQLIAASKATSWVGRNEEVYTGREKWDTRPLQQSATYHLEAGQEYFLEILHKDGGGDDHTAIAWRYLAEGTQAWSAREVIPAEHLFSYEGDENDADDDYLPDDWETEHELDVKDNGLRDSRQGEDGDFDADGFTNREEYLLGTDPTKVDTDGDSESDYDEVMSLVTNPLVPDSIEDLKVFTGDISQYTNSNINWINTGNGLLAGSYRGEISWDFTVPSQGAWLLRMKTELLGTLFQNEVLPVTVKVDGVTVQTIDLKYGALKTATLQCVTPYITAGTHNLTLVIDNMVARRSIKLLSLGVYQLNNPGAILRKANYLMPRMDISRVSPMCLEGQARQVSNVLVGGAQVSSGMGGGHWFTNLPLQAQDAAQVVNVRFEVGDLIENSVIWQATNVFDREKLIIRQGDSLRVGAWKSDTSSSQQAVLTHSAGGQWTVSGTESQVIQFSDAGVYSIQAQAADGSTATLNVTVLEAPVFAYDVLDAVDSAPLPIWLPIEPLVEVDFKDTLCRVAELQSTPAAKKVSFVGIDGGDMGLVTRAGVNGTILGVQRMNVIELADAIQNAMTSSGNSAVPGYRLLSTPVTVTHMPEGARIDAKIMRAGVLFLNGDTTFSLYPEDFVQSTYQLKFLFPMDLPGAYCHYMEFYGRRGEYIGTR
jgi:hypothetical protein